MCPLKALRWTNGSRSMPVTPVAQALLPPRPIRVAQATLQWPCRTATREHHDPRACLMQILFQRSKLLEFHLWNLQFDPRVEKREEMCHSDPELFEAAKLWRWRIVLSRCLKQSFAEGLTVVSESPCWQPANLQRLASVTLLECWRFQPRS